MHRHNEKGENTLANDKIIIKGAREHNLKNINLTLPREKLIVMTGLSRGRVRLTFFRLCSRAPLMTILSFAKVFSPFSLCL